MTFFQFVSGALLTCVLTASSLLARDDASIVAEVIAADQARGTALLAADTQALDRLLADDLFYRHSDGKQETKAIHIGTITDGLRYERFITSELRGHVISTEVVILTGKIDQKKLKAGKASEGQLMFQSVWRHESTGWRMAGMQTAVIPKKP
jgi:ketosteroid isomerase-like protein